MVTLLFSKLKFKEVEGLKMPDKWLEWDNGKEWGKIQCPMLGENYVMTYYPEGLPCYYSYTLPFVDGYGDVCYYRFDHDEGCWDEDTLFCMEEYLEGTVVAFGN